MKTSPIKVQPIATFEQRQVEYRSELHQFLLCEFSLILAVCMIVSMGFVYLFVHFNSLHIPAEKMDWRLVGLGLGIGLSIPPFIMTKPRRPDPNDVARDQALRRAFDMDDSLSKE